MRKTLQIIRKGVFKAALVPILAVLKLMEWMTTIVQLMSGWVFRILGLIMLVTAFFSWGFQLEETAEIIHMSVMGVIVFLLPMVWEILMTGIMMLELLIKKVFRRG